MSVSRLKVIIVFAFVFGAPLALPAKALAQESGEAYTIGHWQSIESDVLDEMRSMLVYLPNEYEESEQSYPVLYLLDGPHHFHHTRRKTNLEMIKALIHAIGNSPVRE